MAESTKSDLRKIYRTAVGEDFPATLRIVLGEREIEYEKIRWHVEGADYGMRYGTNPHQQAALYRPKRYEDLFFGNIEWKKMGKEGPSATNLEDGYRGLRICSYFQVPAVAIMKHVNPCGVAIGTAARTVAQVLEDAYNCDSRAAFGSVVCFNTTVTEDAVEILSNIYEGRYNEGMKSFLECLFASDFDPGVLDFLKEKKQIRVARIPDMSKVRNPPFDFDLKRLGDTFELERPYYSTIKSVDDLKKRQVVTKRKPTEEEWKQMFNAWIVCGNKRSNGVVFWKGNRAISIGTGQQDRIGAIEVAISKADRTKHGLEGSVLASDGFMLWDNVDPLGPRGVSAIVQPGGSMSDDEVIRKADEYNIAMVMTGERCFRHF